MKRISFVTAIIVCLLLSVLASAGGPSGEQVISALKRNFDAVKDYRADVTLTAKGEKVSINKMKMVVYFKKPNKVHVEAVQGFAAIPNGSFFGNPLAEIASRSRPVYLRSEKKLGRDCHLLKLVNVNSGPNSEALLWVDKAFPVIVAMETPGDYGVKTVWRHEKIDGRYYLPVEIIADIRAPKGPNGGQPTKVTLKFANYSVNKGISDKIFQEKPRK